MNTFIWLWIYRSYEAYKFSLSVDVCFPLQNSCFDSSGSAIRSEHIHESVYTTTSKGRNEDFKAKLSFVNRIALRRCQKHETRRERKSMKNFTDFGAIEGKLSRTLNHIPAATTSRKRPSRRRHQPKVAVIRTKRPIEQEREKLCCENTHSVLLEGGKTFSVSQTAPAVKINNSASLCCSVVCL